MKLTLVKYSVMWMAAALMLAGTAVFAEDHAGRDYIDFSKETPSGTIKFNVTAVKLLVGATWGQGVLHYQGKDYALKVSAATVGGLGYQSIEGEGEVYFLSKLDDFTGKYGGGGMSVTVGAGKGVATLENKKSVILRLKSKSGGLALGSGLGSVGIKFAE